jgi:hypothetical protein
MSLPVSISGRASRMIFAFACEKSSTKLGMPK